MKPLVRASEANRKFLRTAVFSFVVLAVLTLVFALPLASGDPGLVAMSAVLILLVAWAIFAWIRRVRRATGSAPVLLGENLDDGLVLTCAERGGTWGSRRSVKAVAIPRGHPVWLTEERPDTSMEFLLGPQPYRYWVVGERSDFAITSYSRLTREDLGDLQRALADNGSEFHVLLERTAGEGPIHLAPVVRGAPVSITLGVPDGHAVVGAYSDRGTAGWVPRHQAYASGAIVPVGGALPISITFGAEHIDATEWVPLLGFRLHAYADTLVLATRGGVPQVVAPIPYGFSGVHVLRGTGSSSNRIYVDLDGPPPSA